MRVSDLNIDRIYINSVVRTKSYKMAENHFHYYYELFYVRHGQCKFFINQSLYELRSGDFLIIPPHVVHLNRYFSQCTRINIYFTESDVNRLLDTNIRIKDELRHTVLVHIPTAYRTMFHQVLDQMLQEDTINDAQTKYMMQLMFEQFLIMTSRHCVIGEQKGDTVSSKNDQEILSAAKYISEHYSEQITLGFLAERAGLSPNYFSKKFRSVTGTGMKEYLNAIRLEHAARELVSTQLSIMDVALDCGFSDGNYFKDIFKKTYGVSPRAYRTSITTDLKHQGTLTRTTTS